MTTSYMQNFFQVEQKKYTTTIPPYIYCMLTDISIHTSTNQYICHMGIRQIMLKRCKINTHCINNQYQLSILLHCVCPGCDFVQSVCLVCKPGPLLSLWQSCWLCAKRPLEFPWSFPFGFYLISVCTTESPRKDYADFRTMATGLLRQTTAYTTHKDYRDHGTTGKTLKRSRHPPSGN